MSNSEIQYEDYNDRSYAVRGDKNKFSIQMKELGGRWNPRMRGGPGWLVPKDRLNELRYLIETTSMKSRKGQTKYRREDMQSHRRF